MKLLGIFAVVIALAVTAGLSDKPRPTLPECGELLPSDSQYGLALSGSWDTSTNPASGNVSMTLTNLATGESPDILPPVLEPFRACAMQAVGLL